MAHNTDASENSNATKSVMDFLPKATKRGKARDADTELIKYYPLAESDDNKFWDKIAPLLAPFGCAKGETSRFVRMRAMAMYMLNAAGQFPAPTALDEKKFVALQKEWKFLRVGGEGSLHKKE